LVAVACILPLFAHVSGATATRQGATTVEAQNEAAVLRVLYDGLDGRNFAVLSEVLSPTYVAHTPFGTAVGIPAFEKIAGTLIKAFPDVHLTVLEVVSEGDTVVVRDLTTATQKGPFLGIPATGKKVSWSEYQFWHLSHGKVVEEWVTFDTLGLLQQLKGS
jgi:predicted ester cyclase